MNNTTSTRKNMGAKSKNTGLLSCSTPENRDYSPSRDSDSMYDSDSASPVPFICTQDGAEGETDVVWNFYTPKSEKNKVDIKNSTPLSRKSKRCLRPKLVDSHLPKRRALQSPRKKTELLQDLMDLKKNLPELIRKNAEKPVCKPQSGSEEDIFSDSSDNSPKTRRSSVTCLRRNVLSSNFSKPDTEYNMESDDSLNECLIKASQVVEDILEKDVSPQKESNRNQKFCKINRPSLYSQSLKNDTMDVLMGNVKLQSPVIQSLKACDSPRLNDDSFDNIIENLNDSVFEQLTQMPVKMDISNKDEWKVKEFIVHGNDSLSKSFVRHSTMPESPTVPNVNKPSTSGTVFGRFNTMPLEPCTKIDDDSPKRCTPDQIKRKHQIAREKLQAKRLLPFTSSKPKETSKRDPVQPLNTYKPEILTLTNNNPIINNAAIPHPIAPSQLSQSNRNTKFQPKIPSKRSKIELSAADNLQTLLDRKRQEARRRLDQKKLSLEASKPKLK